MLTAGTPLSARPYTYSLEHAYTQTEKSMPAVSMVLRTVGLDQLPVREATALQTCNRLAAQAAHGLHSATARDVL